MSKLPPDIHRDRRSLDPAKTISLIANGIMLAGVIVSLTVAVQKTESYNVNSRRIDGLVTVTDNMKDVDSGLLQQVTELRGTTTADIMVLKERIENVTRLLEEIKAIVMRRQ
jgi:hypothetical protein